MSEIVTLTRRRLQKENTRRHILETALSYCAQNGFSSVSTSDLAQAAGVSHGTIFVHFATREALLKAVIEEFGSRVSSRLHQLVFLDNSLRDVLEAHLKGLTEFEPFYTRLVMECRLLPPEVRNTVILIQSSISFHISQAAEKEMKEGRIIACPVHLLFNTWVGLVHYYLANNDLFAPVGSVLQRYGQELIDHYLNLVEVKL